MSRGAGDEGFSRRHRFVGRGSFVAALRSPSRRRSACFILHAAPGRPGESRLGLVIGKRHAKRAHVRNRMKRLVREAFRRHRVKLSGLDLVFAPRKPFRQEEESEWIAQLKDLMDQVARGG